MTHHHAHGHPGQFVTQARVLSYQFNQFSPNGRGNGLRGGEAAGGALGHHQRSGRPLALRLTVLGGFGGGGGGGCELGGLWGRALLGRSSLRRRRLGG